MEYINSVTAITILKEQTKGNLINAKPLDFDTPKLIAFCFIYFILKLIAF